MKNSTKLLISVLIIVIAAVLLYLGLTYKVPQTMQSSPDQASQDTGAMYQ